MFPQEIIRKKRDGKTLSSEEISFFVKGITDGSIADSQTAALTMAIFLNGFDKKETVDLTLSMRDSGDVLKWDLNGPVIDKHSSGGVGDKVSLMLAPILAACGGFVPMISGRGLGHTGGTLDKFDSIPGYQTQPTNELFKKTVKEVIRVIDAGQGDDADQVGDHHQAVEGIGNIPSQRGGHYRAKHNGANVNDLKYHNALCAENVFPSLGTVVAPAENGGECEEEHCDSNELLTDVTPREYRVERTAYESCICVSCSDLTGNNVEYATLNAYVSGGGADDGIAEGVEAIHICNGKRSGREFFQTHAAKVDDADICYSS